MLLGKEQLTPTTGRHPMRSEDAPAQLPSMLELSFIHDESTLTSHVYIPGSIVRS